SARTCAAVRCFPASERSVSSERRPARAPVSIPSDVAPSGPSFTRLSATSSSSLSASASPGVAGPVDAAGAPPPPQLAITGNAAVDASAAIASRRVIIGRSLTPNLNRSIEPLQPDVLRVVPACTLHFQPDLPARAEVRRIVVDEHRNQMPVHVGQERVPFGDQQELIEVVLLEPRIERGSIRDRR